MGDIPWNKMASTGGRVSCGFDFHCAPDLNGCLDRMCKAGYEFLCVPLVNPRYKREFLAGPAKNRPGPLTRSDLVLASSDWTSLVVGKISEWIRTDSPLEFVRKNSEMAFVQELQFASHLSVPAIMIPLHGPDCVNLARLLNHHLLSGNNHQFWLRVPMVSPEDSLRSQMESGCGDADKMCTDNTERKHDTWKWWNTVRTLCDTHKKISLSLEISEDIPSPEELDRWFGEPIRSAIIHTDLFLTNKQGFPVLSKAHQALVRRFFKLDIQFVISGINRHASKGVKVYQQYLDHLYQTQEPVDSLRSFAKGYEDYLQCPLQPLMDNLESQTYEVFEKDPVKYTQYQRAIYEALIDRVPNEMKDDITIIVMVLGAGRGPLVRASLAAAHSADRKIKVFAVEKNPNAVVTLENLKAEIWGDYVTVVSSDMRVWNAPEKADIIVSELLGSFGDNELSPECLDGAQKFLKDDGISIPCKYTSYLAPLTSSKLWNETRACKDPGKIPEANFETPYVVHLHNCNVLTESKPVFTFHHPNKDETIDNNRYEILKFTINIDTVIHGFGGYFDTVLYKDVTFSIVPETHSPGMFSWFPIYFPIRDPFYITSGTEIEVHFWRINNGKNVWYEWCISRPEPHPVHNPKGRSYTIGL